MALHPPLLDESGLSSAIRWYADGFSKRSRVKLTLELDERSDRLGQDVETGLFRIVQEALTNVHRHSGAEAVHIRLKFAEGCLALSIQDDGKGIPSEALQTAPKGIQGVGLSSMRERSAILGGTFHVETNNRGTSIHVGVPLRRYSARPPGQQIIRGRHS